MKKTNRAGALTPDWLWCARVFFGLLVSHTSLAGEVDQNALAAISAEPNVLEPERAFMLSARIRDAKTVELVYKITDGYYMYRKRFSVVAEPKASAILGRPTFGKGEMKQDATFGKVEVFRDSMRILIPVASIGSGSNMGAEKLLRLKVTSQGCADAGICYPPLHQTITLVSGSHDVKHPDTVLGVGGITQPPQSKAGSTEPSLSELLRKAK